MGLSQAPNRPATKKQRKPEPARVVETYYYEVKARGQWGAYTRTAAVYRLSDETIRRYVKQAEQPPAPPLDAELAYQPAPGEKPIAPRTVPQLPQKQQRHRPTCHAISPKRMMHTIGILRQPVRSNVANVAQYQLPTFPTIERETVPRAPGKLPQIAAPRTYPKRPAPRPAHARVVERIREHVNPYMAIAFLAVALLVLAVQYVH